MELAPVNNNLDSTQISLGNSASLKARIGWQGLTTKEYQNSGDYILVTGTDFKNGFIDWGNCVYVSEFRYNQDVNIQLKAGDVLVTKDGTIGKVAIIDKLPYPATLNSGVFVVRPLGNAFAPEYLYYILRSSVFKSFLDKLTAGSTINHLYQKDFVHFSFNAPTLEEQKKIAEVLSDTDKLIQSLERKIAKKQLIKKGAMQELLSPKEEWDFKKLGDIAEIYTGKRNNQDKVENGKFPFFVRSKLVEKINSYSFEGEAILVPGEGNIGSIFHYINGKFDFHQRVYKISDFKEGYSGKYTYHYMCEYFGRHALENSVKATVDSLRLPTFQDFEIPFPPNEEEQFQIIQILSSLNCELDRLNKTLSKYKLLKQSLMQQLLTGKIRLI